MRYDRVEKINWEKEFPQVPECVHNVISDVQSEILASKIKKRFFKKRMLLLVAVITLLSGVTVFASVGLWQQRMEAMNQEEIENYFLSIATSKAPSFRYSRVLTEKEKLLWEEMKSRYENEGIFPKGILTMLDSADEYHGKGIGYDKKSGTFLLPERELTQEQMLQIIDFYHKSEYAVSKGNKVEKEWEINQEEKEKKVINDKISVSEISLKGEELLVALTAGKDYLYLGFQTEIKRMPVGGESTESFYKLQENQTVFALGSDNKNQVYLSLREYDEERGIYVNRLLKIDKQGKAAAEYDLEKAVYQQDKTAMDMLAYKMVVDEKGNLYLKCRNCSEVIIFIFDSQGKYLGKMDASQYKTHEVNGMCLGEDGFLYVLAINQIIKIDITTKEVVEVYDFRTEEMTAMADVVYPVNEKNFYLLSYDGLFQYSVEDGLVQKILSPLETDVFSEGWRYTPVTKNQWVFINLTDDEKFKYRITYLSFE